MAGPLFSVSGFGTVGAVYHNEPDIRYRRDVAQGSGVAEGSLSFKPDSMLGVQLDAQPGRSVGATVQVVSRLTAEDDYKPELTMAYLKFSPAEDVSVRLGRMILESYLQGDAAEIGYANLSIRQPIIYYPRSFDGVDAEATYPLASGILRVQGSAGWAQGKTFPSDELYDTAGSRIWGSGAEYARNGWTGRFYVSRLKMNDEAANLQPGEPLPAAMALAPNGARILERMSVAERALTLKSLALVYDSGPLRGLASYSTITSSGWPTRRIFYVNMGYRCGNVTPYVSYASQRSSRDIVPTGLASSAGFDAIIQGSAVAQSALMINQSDLALGARYDFAERMALKLQVDHIRYRDPESILDASLSAISVESRGWRSFNLLSIALDFVF